jgi:hypothetical protein
MLDRMIHSHTTTCSVTLKHIASIRHRLALPLIALLLIAPGLMAAQNKTENLILIILDGVRTNEVFQGVDLELMKVHAKKKTVEETDLYKQFWAESAIERRERLMPFFWNVWMKDHGSIAGDRWNGSEVVLTNSHWFSYPGYSEILTGQAHDEEINSNAPVQNPYPSVMEFFASKLDVPQSGIASFASWSVMDYIVEKNRGTIFSNAGYEPYASSDPVIQAMSDLQFKTLSPWDTVRHDAYTFRFAMDYLKTHRPRVMYMALGETDDWGHEKRYDRVVQAIHANDGYFRELWEFVQSDEQYKDKTTILVTTDHGRGDQVEDWPHHRSSIESSKYCWIAVVGPDHTKQGSWQDIDSIGMNQVAATLSAFLGLDYAEWNQEAGRPIYIFLE